MRKYAEVIQPSPVEDKDELVACLDVTDEPDGGLSVMADLKTIYPGCNYQWHECKHDDRQGCLMIAA